MPIALCKLGVLPLAWLCGKNCTCKAELFFSPATALCTVSLPQGQKSTLALHKLLTDLISLRNCYLQAPVDITLRLHPGGQGLNAGKHRQHL